MRNWNDFLQEFVLRTLTQVEVLEASDEAYYIRASIRIARESWDAIQAAELPESEKAKQTKNYDLKLWAKKAIESLGQKAEWIAIDSDGSVYAYDIRPNCITMTKCWSNAYNNGNSTLVGAGVDVKDWTKEFYEISKILSDDVQ